MNENKEVGFIPRASVYKWLVRRVSPEGTIFFDTELYHPTREEAEKELFSLKSHPNEVYEIVSRNDETHRVVDML